jgi:hypothetical protein
MSGLSLQPLQTAIPNHQYSGSYDYEPGDGQDGGGDFTARPANAHNHSEALWFQPRDGSGDVPVKMDEDAVPSNIDASTTGMAIDGPSDNSQFDAAATAATMAPNGLSRPLTPIEQERLAQLDRLKFFLATAPARWDAKADANIPGTSQAGAYGTPGSHPALNRFLLPTQEFVTCVLWNGLYHITGTDIVRALVFRCVPDFICPGVIGRLTDHS